MASHSRAAPSAPQVRSFLRWNTWPVGVCSLLVFLWNLFLSTVSQGHHRLCRPCTSGAHSLERQGPWGNLS